jgi:hypothetical protein
VLLVFSVAFVNWKAVPECGLTKRAADLVVGQCKKLSPGEEFFRFDARFSHKAANASR